MGDRMKGRRRGRDTRRRYINRTVGYTCTLINVYVYVGKQYYRMCNHNNTETQATDHNICCVVYGMAHTCHTPYNNNYYYSTKVILTRGKSIYTNILTLDTLSLLLTQQHNRTDEAGQLGCTMYML